MKNNMVKKLLTLALAGAMTLSLAACGSKSDDSSNDAQQGGDESGKTYKVAIIKQLDHASLDEIANAVAAELDKIAADNNVTIEYDITSGQNDQTILKQLSDQRSPIRSTPSSPSRRPPRRSLPSPLRTPRPPLFMPPSPIPRLRA